MTVELAPLHSYVRFYQTVVTQLTAAWENVARMHEQVRVAVEPFAGPLAPVGHAALAAAAASMPPEPPALGELWRPSDAEGLSGMNDVYEVVGRFTFQGEDDANLKRVQALVSGARNEIVTQRTRLAELVRLPAFARERGERMGTTEKERSEADRRQQIARFEPLADVLRSRAKQTAEAVRQVAPPDLANPDTAVDVYRKYVAKLQSVYQTCLPYLKTAISDVFAFVSAEVPSSWPDVLPVAEELPVELVTVPPKDSPDLSRAAQQLRTLAEEEPGLLQAREDVASAVARLEGEIAACITLSREALEEAAKATLVHDYTLVMSQLEEALRAKAAFEALKEERSKLEALVMQKHRAVEAEIAAIERELKQRAADTSVLGKTLDEQEKDEPVLFGKDAWNARVAELRGRLVAAHAAETQRTASANQLRMKLAALSVDLQTEQQQTSACERSILECQGKETSLTERLRELADKLGSARPVGFTKERGESELAAAQKRRSELAERLKRLKGEAGETAEKKATVEARLAQIENERKHAQARLESAQVAATEGREAAIQRLAIERKAAVERHVNEVLESLEKSLANVDAVFLEPAREALARAREETSSVAAVVLERAEKLDPLVHELAASLEQELLAQEAMLSQIQREFCEAAPAACRSAWG